MSESIEKKRIKEAIRSAEISCHSQYKERAIVVDLYQVFDRDKLDGLIKVLDKEKMTIQQRINQMAYLQAVVEGVRVRVDEVMTKIDNQLISLCAANSLKKLEQEIENEKKKIKSRKKVK